MTAASLFLWCVPRSASTAFERVFAGREDIAALHEPFAGAYYFGPERPSARYADQPPDAEQSYGRITARISGAGAGKKLFIKDMAYHYEPRTDDEFLTRAAHSFLIRHPAATLSSLHEIWPDFTLEETGYPALLRLYEKIEKLTGAPPLLLDAEEVCAAPEKYFAHYCRHAGIPFDGRNLKWKPGLLPGWLPWARFHEKVAASAGIRPLRPPPAPDTLPPYAREMAERVMPLYETLYARRTKI